MWCARHLISPDDAFAVILPDDVIATEKPCLLQILDAFLETGVSMVAAMEIPSENTSSYSVLDVKEEIGPIVLVKGMVEMPDADRAPSNLAVIGRYLLSPKVLDHLQCERPVVGGELRLTSAIAAEIDLCGEVYGYRVQGQRFDCGSKAGFLQATVAFGLSRTDLRDEFSDFLATMADEQRIGW